MMKIVDFLHGTSNGVDSQIQEIDNDNKIQINKEKEAKSLTSKFSLSLLKESETEGPPPYLSVRKKTLCVMYIYRICVFYIFLLFRTQTKPPLIYFCVCGSFSVTKSKSKTIFYCNNFF